MPNSESDLAIVTELMQAAVKLMARFPQQYVPPVPEFPEKDTSDSKDWIAGTSVAEILARPEVPPWVQTVLDSLPQGFSPIFLGASSIIAQILAMFGVDRSGASFDIFRSAMASPDSVQLMMAMAEVDKESKKLDGADDSEKDPLGFKTAAMNELLRRSIASRAPFARTLTTLLGPDALLWLTADSQEGKGKIQPHEFSRTGWYRIWGIDTQIAIEQELLAIPLEAQYLSKSVVALAWTLAGLASFIPHTIFLEEQTSHLISIREGQYTVASGTGSRTLVLFHASAMRSVLEVLATGLTNSLLNAADLMWMGAALARIRQVVIRHIEPVPIETEKFGLFLSHRGRDAKQVLAKAVQSLPPTHGVFLDCMTLPRGVVNRSFIYNSLARSEEIIIVESENYNESEWCRKEAWFSEALRQQQLASVQRVRLPDAVDRINARGSHSLRKKADHNLKYPITQRVLKDIYYWARRPNLHSLKEAGHETDSLKKLEEALDVEPRPNDAHWAETLGQAVADTLNAVVRKAPDASPIDLWAAALQLSVAAFSVTSAARSKDEVRRGIDHLNGVLKSFIASTLHVDPIFRKAPSGYLGLLAAACAIQLAGYDLDPRLLPAVRRATTGAALVHDGLLVLNVREAGPRRTFHLRLLALLVTGNLGGVGIVQNAHDAVHQQQVDGVFLEILPCVTLYPGIEALFT